MKQDRLLKKTACLTVFIYISLSAYMLVGMARHAMQHGRSPHNAAQHTSFICTWMCAATTYVNATDQTVGQQFIPVFGALSFSAENVLPNKPLLVFRIRPPPFILL